MCDLDNFNELQKPEGVSRRQFGALGLGAGLAAMLPRLADAAETSEAEVTIKTPDGNCDAHFVYPRSGASAAVLVWPDVFGLRNLGGTGDLRQHGHETSAQAQRAELPAGQVVAADDVVT
jgi:hypothetical protein